MKKTLFALISLVMSLSVCAQADTTFAWSQGGQKGTLTYTSLGLASPTISGTVTDTATHTLTANKLYVGNDSSNRTEMGIAAASDVSLSQDGTNVTITLDDDVVAPAEMADADHGDVAWSSGVASVEAVQDAALDGMTNATPEFNTVGIDDKAGNSLYFTIVSSTQLVAIAGGVTNVIDGDITTP